MTKQRKKLSKLSLTGFILSLITPLSFFVAFFYFENNHESLFIVTLLWSLFGFWVAQAAHTFSEIGIIICAVKKKRGIALSVIGIVISKFIMLAAFIAFMGLFIHESPPMPAPTEEAEYNSVPTSNEEYNPDPSGNAEYNSAPTGEAVVDTLTPKGYVSVDLFKSFYRLDDEIDDRFIEDFILFQQITEDDLLEYDYSKDLVESFDNGDYSQFGYSMNWNELNFQELTLNNRTDITNAIDNARWIYMVFEVPIPDSDETERVTMLSDFYHDMFYYAVDEDNYHNSGRKLDLTELAKEIQVDMIPEDAERQNPDRDKYALSYKYDVYIFTYDRKYIHISNDTYYRFHQSFDVYWKLVYYREFDEEFEVSAAGT